MSKTPPNAMALKHVSCGHVRAMSPADRPTEKLATISITILSCFVACLALPIRDTIMERTAATSMSELFQVCQQASGSSSSSNNNKRTLTVPRALKPKSARHGGTEQSE
eukprot:scaffold294_cov221-Amphora_coffeaeformis.AAC.58